jgi:hypothetical protein
MPPQLRHPPGETLEQQPAAAPGVFLPTSLEKIGWLESTRLHASKSYRPESRPSEGSSGKRHIHSGSKICFHTPASTSGNCDENASFVTTTTKDATSSFAAPSTILQDVASPSAAQAITKGARDAIRSQPASAYAHLPHQARVLLPSSRLSTCKNHCLALPQSHSGTSIGTRDIQGVAQESVSLNEFAGVSGAAALTQGFQQCRWRATTVNSSRHSSKRPLPCKCAFL